MLNTTIGIQVLVADDLRELADTSFANSHRTHHVYGSTAISGNDSRIGQEIFPNFEPPLTVFGDDFILVGNPVPIPTPKSCRVMYTSSVHRFDLKASRLKVVHEETKGGRGIGTGEDVLVHEKTPDKILLQG